MQFERLGIFRAGNRRQFHKTKGIIAEFGILKKNLCKTHLVGLTPPTVFLLFRKQKDTCFPNSLACLVGLPHTREALHGKEHCVCKTDGPASVPAPIRQLRFTDIVHSSVDCSATMSNMRNVFLCGMEDENNLLNFLAPISLVVLAVGSQGEQDSSCAFRVAVLDHNLAKYFCGIKEF